MDNLKIRLKKSLSGFLIFSLLFGQTVSIPLVNTSSASETQYPNLVSILIPASLNSGDVKSAVKTYAEDVQQALPGGRVSIFEIPDDMTPEKIATLQEKLYYDGDGNGGASRLVGTVLIGDIPLPVVHKGEKSFLSIQPYVDFIDKAFVYDTINGYYDYSRNSSAGDTPEIWHGIIRPNSGSAEQDTRKIVEFFKKNHDFYTKSGLYSAENTRGEPYVFYFDAYHDQAASSLESWKAYRLGMRYMEDIAYNRFTKHLAKTMSEEFDKISNISDSITNPELKKLIGESSNANNFSGTPDVHTRTAIKQMAKSFFEVLNEKYLGNILKSVYNSGRYGTAKNVHVDAAAILVGKEDAIAKQVTKETNTAFESLINQTVNGGLSRKIALAAEYNKEGSARVYKNYFSGTPVSDISNAAQCSIVRGSTLVVEANRGYSLLNGEKDSWLLITEDQRNCVSGGLKTLSYWGNNSPLNLTGSTDSSGKTSLVFKAPNFYTGMSKPIFDIGGSQEIIPGINGLTINSPLDCLKTDLLLQPYEENISDGDGGHYTERWPVGIRDIGNGKWDYSCTTVHESIGMESFEKAWLQGFTPETCTEKSVILDGTKQFVQSTGGCPKDDTTGEGNSTTIPPTKHNYSYKSIPSTVFHTSPTNEEYGKELMALSTPSLPVDKDRYVEFISAKGNLTKIVYPNLFRIKWNSDTIVSMNDVQQKIKDVLDQKSAEINALITQENPSGLSGSGVGLYNALKTGEYPSASVDLYGTLAKNQEALAGAVFAVYWNNLDNATEKYSYILEHHLDKDGNASFPVAGHKNDYEIAYIGGSGDAKNLYVKVDPEAKWDLPISLASIRSKADAIAAGLGAKGPSDPTPVGDKTVCGPPEGVPIHQWLPALFCWLDSIAVPTIEPGSCTSTTLDMDAIKNAFDGEDSDHDGVPDWMQDKNRNGLLDGYEYIGKPSSKLDLSLPAAQTGFNTNVLLSATFLEKENSPMNTPASSEPGYRQIAIDSYNNVVFDVSRIIDQTDEKKPVVVYDAGSLDKSDRSIIAQYLNFGANRNDPVSVRAKDGHAELNFSTQGKKADVIFRATVSPRDKNGRTVFTKNSNLELLSIRNESISMRATGTNGASISSSVRAGEHDTIHFTFKKIVEDTEGTLNYPLSIRLYDAANNTILGSTTINTASFDLVNDALKKAGNYRLEVSEKDGITQSRDINVLAANPEVIELTPFSSIFVKGEQNKIAVRIKDRFGNPTVGNLLTLRAKLSGGGFFTENNSDSIEKTIVDGYSLFTISANNGGEEIHFNLSIDNFPLSKEVVVKSIDYAKIIVEVEDRDNIVVRKEPHTIHARVTDKAGNVLTGFNGYVSLNFPKMSGVLSAPLLSIVGGMSETGALLSPNTVAARSLSISASIPGIKDVEGNVIDVHPDVPMRVGLSNEQSSMEARIGNSEVITATLYDQYANVANWKTDGMRADFTLPENYGKYLRFADSKTAISTNFSNGYAAIPVYTTKNPGTPYVTVSVNPGLENNKVIIPDSRTNVPLILSGYGQNLIAIDTYYFWNKEKLDYTDYNSLYTMLLGAGYGDITTPEYLAGELLFRPNSRALAVTALLSPGISENQPLTITPGGKVAISNDSLIEAEFIVDGNRPSIAFFDPFYRDYVARAYLNVKDDVNIIACASSDLDTIDDCNIPSGSLGSYILMKGTNGAKAIKQDGMSLLSPIGTKLVSIESDGKMGIAAGVTIKMDTTNERNFFGATISSNNVDVGYVAFKLQGNNIVMANKDNVAATIAGNRGNIVVVPSSAQYTSKSMFLGNSSRGAKGIAFMSIRENDTFAPDRDVIGKSDKTGLEQYYDEGGETGVGWGGGNKALLELAGGANVGEALRFNGSFNTVNLGDPVLQLAKRGDGTYDKSIGRALTNDPTETIESYMKLDFNNDRQEDLAVFYESGKVRLFLSVNGTFRDMGLLAYVADAGKKRKRAGDFEWDGYSDLVFVTKTGKLAVLQNHTGKVSRIDPTVVNESGIATKIEGSITQLETFDMDHDGKTDLVYTDDSGELAILYGGQKDGNIFFTKKILTATLGLNLDSKAYIGGGAIIYDALDVPAKPTQQDYANASDTTNETAGLESMVNGKIYYYRTHSEKLDPPLVTNDVTSVIGDTLGNDPENPSATNAELRAALEARVTTLNENAPADAVSPMVIDTKEVTETYIRSEWASNKGITFEKTFNKIGSGILRGGDSVRINLHITNTSGKNLSNINVLDTISTTLFQLKNPHYTLTSSGQTTQSGAITELDSEEFDLEFQKFNLAAGKSADISYVVTVNTVSFGSFVVGLLETNDTYGDVAITGSQTCGSNATLWKSIPPGSRNYERTTKIFSDTAALPEEIAKMQKDEDHNGIPDFSENLQLAAQEAAKTGTTPNSLKEFSQSQLNDYNKDTNGNGIPDNADADSDRAIMDYDKNSGTFSLGFDTQDYENAIDTIVQGFGCGFGGGACITSPLNYAPLAPGSSPTLFGFPVAPNLMTPFVGMPIFSFPTIGPVNVLGVPVPPFWPINFIGAGGWFMGPPISQFRIFVTPTITGAVGMAICTGPNAVAGMTPPPGVSPLVPGGNCVIAAVPMFGCKDDGSDGDFTALGYTNNFGFLNSSSCTPKTTSGSGMSTEQQQIINEYVTKSGKSVSQRIKDGLFDSKGMLKVSSAMSSGKPPEAFGPMVNIGGGSNGDSNLDIGLDMEALKNFDFAEVIKIKNLRIPAFPDFLMDWVDRQMEEVTNKLTSLPTLSIILPDFSALADSGWVGGIDKIVAAYKAGEKAYTPKTPSLWSDSSKPLKENASDLRKTKEDIKKSVNSFLAKGSGALNTVGTGISGLKSAYAFLSKLPFIQFENSTVDISIPMLSEEEIDKFITEYEKTKEQWIKEIDTKSKAWGRATTLDQVADATKVTTTASGTNVSFSGWQYAENFNVQGVNEQIGIQSDELLNSINENVRILETYKKFPMKIQKYMKWKQRYIEQILCNVESIQQVMGGWIKDNGKRFKAWVELYILIKAILKAWQLIPDLFVKYKEECSTCRNERYDLKYFIIKLVSALIPKIPVIQFPKLPDIILDLHTIRIGIRIAMPEFSINFLPIILPHLPELHLPAVPRLDIALPGIPKLPELPDLPDLPDLPSLPKVTLPYLPPPPVIPKLPSSITAVLDILRLVAKILCIMKLNPFVPEWRAGDQIAQITERNGKLPIDFLFVNFPNFSYSYLKAVKVTTLVNLEFQADFILEMVKSTASNINQWSSDFTTRTNDDIKLSDKFKKQFDLKDAGPANKTIKVEAPDSVKNAETPVIKPIKPIQIPGTRQSFTPQKLSPDQKQQLVSLFALSLANAFKELLNVMERSKNDTMNVAELKSSLKEQAEQIRNESTNPTYLAIADTIGRAASYDGKAETEFSEKLQSENIEKFNVVKSYLRGELEENRRLQAEFEKFFTRPASNIQTPVIDAIKTSITFGGTDNGNLDSTNAALQAFQNKAMKELENVATDTSANDLKDEADTLRSRISSLTTSSTKTNVVDKVVLPKSNLLAIANTTWTQEFDALTALSGSINDETTSIAASADTSGSIGGLAQSSYSYRGIYYLDGNYRTRLFEYTDEVDGGEDVIKINAEWSASGKEDVVYRMGNALYIKENLRKAEAPANTSSIKTFEANDLLASFTPKTPNYFHETIASPNAINFSFDPANSETDSKFHLEFYDHIEGFDKLAEGENPSSLWWATPKRAIDLLVNAEGENTIDPGEGLLVRKNLANISAGHGSAKVTIPSSRTLLARDSIRVSAGKTIRTDNEWARIKYRTTADEEWTILSIPEGSNAIFQTANNIEVISGKIYLLDNVMEELFIDDLASLEGFPIVPGMYIELERPLSKLEITYGDGSEYTINGPAVYQAYDLGTRSQSYQVSVSHSNDYYYARLYTFSAKEDDAKASITLLSPQTAADTEGPLIGKADFKLPVYARELSNISDVTSDISGITDFWIDADTSVDSNGNGNPGDDRDTLPGMEVNIAKSEMFLGPFDKPMTKNIRLFVADRNGNVSSKTGKLTVYTPIPTIRSATGASITGDLSERRSGEPIDIMRYRSGKLERITPESNVLTENLGSWQGSYTGSDNLVLKTASGTEIAQVNEHSGVITPSLSGATISVQAATKDLPFEIILKNAAGEILYTQNIALPSGTIINTAASVNEAKNSGVSVILKTTLYDFVRNAPNASSLPNGAFIVDTTSRKAVCGVAQDGGVYLMDPSFSLSYRNDGGKVVISLLDKNGGVVADIAYVMNAEFILKQ